MKILIRAAFMVFSLTAGIPAVADAQISGSTQNASGAEATSNAPGAAPQDITASWVNG